MEKGERAPSWRQGGMEVSGDGQPHVREQAVGEERSPDCWGRITALCKML